MLTKKKQPDEDRAEKSTASLCTCGHPLADHVVRADVDLSPCIERGCPCAAFTPQPTE